MTPIERAKEHLRQMDQHVRQRKSAKVIAELLAELEQTIHFNEQKRLDLIRHLEEKQELRDALKLALNYMDDGIQMLFDMDRHGFETDIQSVNRQAYEFDRMAKMVGFKSKYLPRMNPADTLGRNGD